MMTGIDGEHDKISSAKLITVCVRRKKIQQQEKAPVWFDGKRANASAMFIAQRASPGGMIQLAFWEPRWLKKKITYSKVTQAGGKEQWQAEMAVAEQELKATAVSFVLEGHSWEKKGKK